MDQYDTKVQDWMRREVNGTPGEILVAASVCVKCKARTVKSTVFHMRTVHYTVLYLLGFFMSHTLL